MASPRWLVCAAGNAEFFTDERCYIRELLNCEESLHVSIAIARVEPGVTTQLHALKDTAESYVLRKGSGVMEVNGERHRVESGDKVVIPAGAAQRISNTGDVDLEFYCVCTPRFEPGCYINLEPETE